MRPSTFITGVLGDTTKDDGDGDYGDDGEDLVFITKINPGKTGIVAAAHDYEVAVPSKLGGERRSCLLLSGAEVALENGKPLVS